MFSMYSNECYNRDIDNAMVTYYVKRYEMKNQVRNINIYIVHYMYKKLGGKKKRADDMNYQTN